MLWASAISTQEDLRTAFADAAREVQRQLGGAAADLVVLFISAQYAPAYGVVSGLLRSLFPTAQCIGCSAGGIIGGGREVEHTAALSITAAVLPGVQIIPFHLYSADLPLGWKNQFSVASDDPPHFILLPDPFSLDVEALIGALDHGFPTSTKIGGLASGAARPGMNALFLNDQTQRSGAVGVALSGNIEVDTVVAQGCRPIAHPMFITRCQGNILYELDGEPCMTALQHTYETLSREDQQLARHSLFLGIVMEEDRQEYRQGDFLIRNIVGTDREREALAIGSVLRESQVVQFHLRDAATSADDIDQMLRQYTAERPSGSARGALLFPCLGRGIHLYGEPDHDSRALRRHLGDIPVGGFFCNGEIGPVKGTTFLHGYTSAVGLFRSKH